MNNNYHVRDIKQGDRTAFRSFVSDTSDKGFFLALKLLGDPDEARDALQDAYVSVWEKRKSLHEDRNISPWLMKIIVNRCYDVLRKSARTATMSEGKIVARNLQSTDFNHQMDTLEMGHVLNELARMLPPKQKIVFVLSEIEGYSNKEIYQTTGISQNSVKTNLMLARKKVKEMVKNYYAEAKSIEVS